jgi:hypothetical protein
MRRALAALAVFVFGLGHGGPRLGAMTYGAEYKFTL